MSAPASPNAAVFPIYPDLANRVALITGIGQVGATNTETWGNGAATARLFAHNKVRIFGCDLNLIAAERTKSRILAEYPDAEVEVTQCDVTKRDAVEKVVEDCLRKWGQIDVLVNNVGMTAPGDAVTMDEEVWEKQIDLNLKSVFLCCKAVIPVMEKQGSGVVINNASITALRYIGKPQIAYASAKAAVLQFTKASGVMYAAQGIRVNAVVPGLIYSPLVENLVNSEKESDREVGRKICEHNVPIGRMGTPEDVANAVVFLCSGAARYITGHALVVDGGITVSTGTGFSR